MSAAPARSKPSPKLGVGRPRSARDRAFGTLAKTRPKSSVTRSRSGEGVQYSKPAFEQHPKTHDVAGAILSSNALGNDMAALAQRLQFAGFDNMRPMHPAELVSPPRRQRIATGRVVPKRKQRATRPPSEEEQVLSPGGGTPGLFKVLEKIAVENDPSLRGHQVKGARPSSAHHKHPHVRSSPPGRPHSPIPEYQKEADMLQSIREISAASCELLSESQPCQERSISPSPVMPWGEEDDVALAVMAKGSLIEYHRPQPDVVAGSTDAESPLVSPEPSPSPPKSPLRSDPLAKVQEDCDKQIAAALEGCTDLESVAGKLKGVLLRFQQRIGESVECVTTKQASERLVFTVVRDAWMRELQRQGMNHVASLMATLQGH